MVRDGRREWGPAVRSGFKAVRSVRFRPRVLGRTSPHLPLATCATHGAGDEPYARSAVPSPPPKKTPPLRAVPNAAHSHKAEGPCRSRSHGWRPRPDEPVTLTLAVGPQRSVTRLPLCEWPQPSEAGPPHSLAWQHGYAGGFASWGMPRTTLGCTPDRIGTPLRRGEGHAGAPAGSGSRGPSLASRRWSGEEQVVGVDVPAPLRARFHRRAQSSIEAAIAAERWSSGRAGHANFSESYRDTDAQASANPHACCRLERWLAGRPFHNLHARCSHLATPSSDRWSAYSLSVEKVPIVIRQSGEHCAWPIMTNVRYNYDLMINI